MPTTISTVRVVGVPVSDQDVAVRFFAEVLGFEATMDVELQPGFRWVEVAPRGSPVSIALSHAGRRASTPASASPRPPPGPSTPP